MLIARSADFSSLNRVSSFILLTTVALAPLPFGSTDSVFIAVWCVALGMALIAASLAPLRKVHFCYLAGWAVVLCAYALVLHEQLAAAPWLRASPHPIWQEAAELLDAPLKPSVSIAQDQAVLSLGAPLAAMLALACGFIVSTDRKRANQVLRVIAWSGASYAVLGIVAYLIDPTRTLWRDSAYASSLTTPFINRNTAAVYFGSCAIVCSLLFWQEARLNTLSGYFSLLVNSETPRRLLQPLAMFGLCFVAMLLASSRAGVVLSLLGMVLAFTFYFWRQMPRRSGPLMSLLIGGGIALVALQILAARVGMRFDASGVTDLGRLDTYRATLQMIRDHPWFGIGLGSFVRAYPAYRSDEISMFGVWDRAHNVLLEIAAEMGIPLAVLVALGWAVILGTLGYGVFVRRRDLIVPVAALSVAIIAVLHALVDFSLQIPGFAIPALALIGAGLAQAFSSRPAEKDNRAAD